MSTGETPRLPFGRSEQETKEAFDFCEDIKHAAEFAEHAEQLLLISQRASNKVIHESLLGSLPYQLDVIIPPDNDAFVISDDDDILETQPEHFVATEVRSIGKFGVEFYNGHNRQSLKLSGFNFEVGPIFPNDDLTEVPEYRTEFDSDTEAVQYVNSILEGSMTAEGVANWWNRRRHQLDDRTPHEVWPEDRQKVIDLAYGGMGQQAT